MDWISRRVLFISSELDNISTMSVIFFQSENTPDIYTNILTIFYFRNIEHKDNEF